MPRPILIGDLRGGRNGSDPPLSLPMNQGVEMLNVDWKDATLARKRGGSIAITITGGTAFSGGIQEMGRHVPGSDETLAELWATDGAPIMKRLTGGTSFANVTLDDAISTRPQDVVGVTLNGKRFLAYDSAVDRLHVYDPNLSSPRVRRVNIDPGASAPTVANTGAGAYPAVLRYYRVRWIQKNGTVLARRSEPTPASTNFTPSGAGTAARVTRPTAPGEGETHWEVEISVDNTVWYQLFAVRTNGTGDFSTAIATTFVDDTTALANWPGTGSSDAVGFYSLVPSVKFLMTDGNRLLGAGAWEASGATSGGKGSRVWFTPVLGSSDHADDERVPNTTNQKNWVDLNENDGGAITGLGGPLNGVVVAFKYRHVHRLRPTGDVTTPYLPKKVRDDIGCISHKSITIGEDHAGNAALYWMSHRGPYRMLMDLYNTVQYLGRDNEDIWRTLNLGATGVVSHAIFYPDLHQWWVWIATGSSNDPDTKMMFDVQKGFPDQDGQIRGGWAKHTGDSAGARCACLFANTLGASMSKDLKPYLGRASGTAIYKADTTDLDDNGVAFQAYAKTRPILMAGELGRNIGVEEPYLVAKAQSATTITVTLDRDFGLETRSQTVDLTASGSETRVQKKVDALEWASAGVIQAQLGDGSALASAWTLDALLVPVTGQEPR